MSKKTCRVQTNRVADRQHLDKNPPPRTECVAQLLFHKPGHQEAHSLDSAHIQYSAGWRPLPHMTGWDLGHDALDMPPLISSSHQQHGTYLFSGITFVGCFIFLFEQCEPCDQHPME